jgi:hypothetical protein
VLWCAAMRLRRSCRKAALEMVWAMALVAAYSRPLKNDDSKMTTQKS